MLLCILLCSLEFYINWRLNSVLLKSGSSKRLMVWPGESNKLSFSIQKIMYAFLSLVWRVICVKTYNVFF